MNRKAFLISLVSFPIIGSFFGQKILAEEKKDIKKSNSNNYFSGEFVQYNDNSIIGDIIDRTYFKDYIKSGPRFFTNKELEENKLQYLGCERDLLGMCLYEDSLTLQITREKICKSFEISGDFDGIDKKLLHSHLIVTKDQKFLRENITKI